MTPTEVNLALRGLEAHLLEPRLTVMVRTSELSTLIAAYKQRRSEAEDALRSLTPGGSEFQTVHECLKYIQKQRQQQHEYIVRLASRKSTE